MERYGRGTNEGSQSDPSPEGLEESVWPLGLGGEESYPERPEEADCIFYLRTGYCGYGSRCRFNHPRDRSSVVVVSNARGGRGGGGGGGGGGGDYPERSGQPVCQYYMRTGSCKFGATCKYHHPRHGGGSVPQVPLNYFGYPLRQGEKECSYYVKTGQCKFGPACKFHHPEPTGLQLPVHHHHHHQQPPPPPPQAPPLAPPPIHSPALYPPVQSPSGSSSQQYGVVVARPSMVQGQYVQSPYGTVMISPSMVQFPGWGSPYMTPVSPIPSPSNQPQVGPGPIYGMTQISSAPAYTGSYQPNPSPSGPPISSQKEPLYPERPGQQECQYYLRTGDCKFGPSCRYHHPPPEVIPPRTNINLSPVGLPLRQGVPVCNHYAQRGVCKFGQACKFDHPMGTLSYSPSASSLSDMPVAPYPVGSSIGTLAPSSSSSDLRPEVTSGPTKDSARMSSSMSSSSGSVGSTFSKGTTVSQSGLQQSAQNLGTSSTGASSGKNTESHTSS